MIINTSWLTYAFFFVVLYYFFIFLLSQQWRKPRKRPGYSPYFVVVVPARNEEAVIERTVESLLALDYERFEVLVMNDGSTDRTSELVGKYADMVTVCDRDASIAGRGKGEVLNHAYRIIRRKDLNPDDTIITILDADGRLDANALSVIAPYFADPKVGGVQVPVRIYNAGESLLARMQDIEFVGFSMFVQTARDLLGSVGLGGNGQFVRLSALQSLGESPWSSCLSEDLDIGIRLALRGWRLRFCRQVFVAQHGVLHLKDLFRQRTRWIQGTYECWKHLPSLWKAKHLKRQTRFDFINYLLLVAFVLLVGVNLMLSALDVLGFVATRSTVLVLMSPLPYYFFVSLLSFGPISLFLVSYIRYCRDIPNMRIALILPTALVVYTYILIPCSARALWNISKGRTEWIKTPRSAAVREAG